MEGAKNNVHLSNLEATGDEYEEGDGSSDAEVLNLPIDQDLLSDNDDDELVAARESLK